MKLWLWFKRFWLEFIRPMDPVTTPEVESEPRSWRSLAYDYRDLMNQYRDIAYKENRRVVELEKSLAELQVYQIYTTLTELRRENQQLRQRLMDTN